MAVYLDASAIVKLVIAEPESAALLRFLRAHPERVSSSLSRVEVLRAVRQGGAVAENRAIEVLSRIRLLRVDEDVLDAAASLHSRVVRSLDAIHIASARMLGKELACVVTYDRNFSRAAKILGLPLQAPAGGRAGSPLTRPAPRSGS